MTDKILLADGVEFVPGMVVYWLKYRVHGMCMNDEIVGIETDDTAHHVCGGWLRLRDESRYPHDGLHHHGSLFGTRNGPIKREIGFIVAKTRELTERRKSLEAQLQ